MPAATGCGATGGGVWPWWSAGGVGRGNEGVWGCGGRLGRSINEVLPGFEPGSLDSESRVLTITP